MSTAKGREGEQQAVRFLQQQGYAIVARNVRLGRGELDIIAQDGEVLVFVEVKAHRNRESAVQAVHADKCRRLYSAAEVWLAKHPEHAALPCRFDVIMVSPAQGWRSQVGVEHIKDAFR